jgi:dihydroxyacetone kinase
VNQGNAGADANVKSTTLPIFLPQFLYTAPLMTSLDMKGLSLTILPHVQIENEINAYLTETHHTVKIQITEALQKLPPTCPHWPTCVKLPEFSTVSSVDELFADQMYPLPSSFVEKYSSEKLSSSSSVPDDTVTSNVSSTRNPFVLSTETVRGAMKHVYEELLANENELSRLDSIAGDGDAGLTMRTIAEICYTSVQGYSNTTVSLSTLFGMFAEKISLVAGGSSGILYALILRSVQNYVQSREFLYSTNNTDMDASINRYSILRNCLRTGIQAGSHYGGAKQGDRTMLDSLYSLLAYMDKNPIDYHTNALIEAVEQGAESTKMMVPKAGRASYVDQKICFGHRDAGAHAVAVWVHALASYSWE